MRCRRLWTALFLSLVSFAGCSTGQQSVIEAEGERFHRADPELIITASLVEQLKQPLKIRVSSSRNDSVWLLMSGSVEHPGGGQLDYTGTRYQTAIDSGAFDSSFVALLQASDASQAYQLIELSFGSTDSPLPEWQAEYSLSDELLQAGGKSESLQWQ